MSIIIKMQTISDKKKMQIYKEANRRTKAQILHLETKGEVALHEIDKHLGVKRALNILNSNSKFFEEQIIYLLNTTRDEEQKNEYRI